MKIWIDFINSPQVSFFEPLINELTISGHEVILTCRDSANTVDLLKQRNWKYTVISSKAKKARLMNLLPFIRRVISLLSFLRNKEIDIAVSQSSFYLPIVAALLGVPSIYTNDNEHALGNIPAFLCATKIFIPENLPLSKVIHNGARRSKIFCYPGIKEGIYLWTKGVDIQNKRMLNGSYKKKIYIRPEPLTAQYYDGKVNFLDKLLLDLKEHYSVTILTREKYQLEHYSQAIFSGIEVPGRPLPFEEIAVNCSLFIGAGGSMTREMALLGIPTISVYQDKLLDVDKYLIAEELMIHKPELTFADIEKIIACKGSQSLNMKLVNKGKEAYQFFKQEILKYSKQ
jgi:predicted glycosyltransferase